MTRIFDALRKAQAARGTHHPPASVTPIPAASHFSSTVGRAMASRPGPPAPGAPREAAAAILPLAASLDLPDDALRAMTTLRVSLESTLLERTPRTILFLCATGGEGTSTISSQFACTLARDNRLRVLLVDLHARRPSLEVDQARGAVVLPRAHAGRVPIEPLPIRDNLDAITVGEDARRSGLFSSAALRDLLEAAGAAYDWVVLDGPPVLESPDAAALATAADGVVVVIQSGRTKRPVLARSVELVRKAGGRVLGSVLNRRRLEIPGFIYRRI